MLENLMIAALMSESAKHSDELKVHHNFIKAMWRADTRIIETHEAVRKWEERQMEKVPLPSTLLDKLHTLVYKAATWAEYIYLARKYVPQKKVELN